MKKITLISLLLVTFQAEAQMDLKHGIYLSKSLGNISADISGKHQDFAAFIGTNPEAITKEPATVYDGKISNMYSLGYNLRYVPEVGFGYEFGIYFTKAKMPRQDAALIHSDGSGFKQNTLTGPIDVVVDSPSSYITTGDIYLGGLYNFAKTKGGYQPYVGAGYAKVKGKWNNSYYGGFPGMSGYGESGKTNVNGHYNSVKIGTNIALNYNLELEYSEHKLSADSFRSFQDGSDAKFSRTSINFIYNF